jgi:hypothetical protein
MAITCGFFNSLEGDRKYDARQMGEMFDGLIMDGVFMSIGDALKTTPSSGMTVAVGTGRAWFLHTWTKNDSEYLIEVSAAESVLNRIDTIVLDVDNTEAVRSNTIKLIKGTPASNAKRQTLINTTDHKQIPLADILVPAGATSLANTNITNIVGTSECPYVTGPLSIIQNDDILAAWQEEFDTWFEGVQGTLDGDTAGNLYNLIQQRVEKTSVLDNLNEVVLTTQSGFVSGALSLKKLVEKLFETWTFRFHPYANLNPNNQCSIYIAKAYSLCVAIITWTGSSNQTAATFSEVTIPEKFRPVYTIRAYAPGVSGTAFVAGDAGRGTRFTIKPNGKVDFITNTTEFIERYVCLAYWAEPSED